MLIQQHTEDTHTHSAGITWHLLKHSHHKEIGCGTALQATARTYGNPKVPWKVKWEAVFKDSVFSFYKKSVQMSLIYLRNKLLYVFLTKSPKGEH